MTLAGLSVAIVMRDHLSFVSGAEQIMHMSAPVQRWTADRVRTLMDESRAWPRYELVAGELLVTPAPRPVHQLLVGELFLKIAEYTRHMLAGVDVPMSAADLELVPGNIVQPDIFVFRLAAGTKLDDWAPVRSLLFAIEVLSPSSGRSDRVTKRRFFTTVADVREYWVVDPDARAVERWMHGDDRPSVVDGILDRAPAGAPEPLRLDLPSLFARAHRE